jgi:adenosylhomocysteine nucleosidase
VPTLRVGDVVTTPRIVTVDHLVTDIAEKRRLSESHDAVDMESSAVAEVCTARGVAFLAVRVVSDTVDTALSPELVRLLSGGNVSAWRACGALVRRPALLSEFLRLARDTRFAARKLAEALVKTINTEPHGPRPWGSD